MATNKTVAASESASTNVAEQENLAPLVSAHFASLCPIGWGQITLGKQAQVRIGNKDNKKKPTICYIPLSLPYPDSALGTPVQDSDELAFLRELKAKQDKEALSGVASDSTESASSASDTSEENGDSEEDADSVSLVDNPETDPRVWTYKEPALRVMHSVTLNALKSLALMGKVSGAGTVRSPVIFPDLATAVDAVTFSPKVETLPDSWQAYLALLEAKGTRLTPAQKRASLIAAANSLSAANPTLNILKMLVDATGTVRSVLLFWLNNNPGVPTAQGWANIMRNCEYVEKAKRNPASEAKLSDYGLSEGWEQLALASEKGEGKGSVAVASDIRSALAIVNAGSVETDSGEILEI
jgi:hypothetical protein